MAQINTLPHPPDHLNYNTSYTETGSEPIGATFWNTDDETVSLKVSDDVKVEFGQELHYPVINQTGAQIDNGTPVMYAGTVGNSGRIKIQKAIADGSILPQYALGIATEDIPDGETGKVTWFGKVRGLDTTGTPYGETWNDADLIFISADAAGNLTNVQPSAPNRTIFLAVVMKAHSNGTLFVHPRFTNRLAGLDDVSMTPTDGDLPVWNDANSRFEAVNVSTIAPSGYTPGSVLFAGADGTITEDNARLFFDNALNNAGVNTITPRRKLDILDATTPQIRLTHTDNSIYTDLQVDSSGIFSIFPSGNSVMLNGATTSAALSVLSTQGAGFNLQRGNVRVYVETGLTGIKTKLFRSQVAGSVNFLQFGTHGDVSKSWNIGQSSSGIDFEIEYGADGFTNNPNFKILSTGQVGINTISPAQRLEIVDTSGIQARHTYTAGSIFADVGVDANGYYSIIPSGLRVVIGTADSTKLFFGAGQDASLYYDGTNLNINPKDVGTGILDVLGTLQTDGYNAGDGTAGATQDVTLAAVTTLSFKNGLFVGAS